MARALPDDFPFKRVYRETPRTAENKAVLDELAAFIMTMHIKSKRVPSGAFGSALPTKEKR